jgi:hypothetical protein
MNTPNLDALLKGDRRLPCSEAKAELDKLKAKNKQLRGALVALTTCPHLDLGDLIYKVRDSEGEGWDGPAVRHWSKAVTDAQEALKR